MNVLKKTHLWLVASMLIAQNAFAQMSEKKESSPQRENKTASEPMMPIYSAPARVDVRSSWDLYVTGRFIYWQAREENLEIGLISRNDPEGLIINSAPPFSTSFVNNTNVADQRFTFRPGFKIGLGANLDNDNWDAFAEYTWFHSETTGRVNPLPRNNPAAALPTGEYLYAFQGAAAAIAVLPTSVFPFFFQSATQSWHLKTDFVDLSLARSYYSGMNFTVRPFFGARGAWIRQHLNTVMNGSLQYLPQTGGSTLTVHNSSISWGIGPRLGFEGNWLIGKGLRLVGNGSSDILYTRYSLQFNEQIASQTPPPYFANGPIYTNASVSQEIDYLRTHAELELGFGWGSYFDHNKWHIDLSATYGFQVFWDQNMFREFENHVMQAKSFSPNGNLYIHGMTISANLDF